MIQVTSTQIDALAAAARARLAADLAVRLAARFPALAPDPAAFRVRIGGFVEEAAGMGAGKVAALARWAEWRLLAPAFPDHPAARAILCDTSVPADDRILALARNRNGVPWRLLMQAGAGR